MVATEEQYVSREYLDERMEQMGQSLSRELQLHAQSTTERLTAVEGRLTSVEGKLDRILDLLEGRESEGSSSPQISIGTQQSRWTRGMPDA